MKSDAGKHVIICRSYGSYQAYACTLANAKAILDNHLPDLITEIKALAEILSMSPQTVWPVTANLVQGAFQDILDKKPGEAAPKLRRLLYGGAPRDGEDTRPEVVVSEDQQKELVMWLFENGLSARPLDSKLTNLLNELHPEKALQSFKPFADRITGTIHYVVYPDYLKAAQELNVLQANRWKEDAEESKVVARILRFVCDILTDTNDVLYEVVEVSEKFE